jgi:hypothetical protein
VRNRSYLGIAWPLQYASQDVTATATPLSKERTQVAPPESCNIPV